MAAGRNTQQIRLALQELESELRGAYLYAARFGKGWDRVVELQGLYEKYQEALEQAHRAA